MESAIGLSSRRSWTVSALCRSVADTLDTRLNPVQVQGEIGSFIQAGSGHCYFNLKDAESQLRCAMFRRAASALTALPANGDKVEVIARLGVHAPRGDLQLIVEELRPAGQGASMEQFLRLKAKLEGEGLFAPERKRLLTRIPRCIGLVTSPDAAALSDVITALARRVPHIPVVLSPCAVQGVGSERTIVQALETLYACVDDPDSNAAALPEVILVVRGGGGWEDLHAFNDESVVRCIARSPVPVIVGVGHETDFTIADFVADLRAATPTAAAELCAVSGMELVQQLDDISSRLERALMDRNEEESQRLDWLAANLSRPDDGLREMASGLDLWAQRLTRSLTMDLSKQTDLLDRLGERVSTARRRHADTAGVRLQGLDFRLAGVSPHSVLARGFAWLEGPQGLVKGVGDVAAGDAVRATLVDGVVELVVVSTSG